MSRKKRVRALLRSGICIALILSVCFACVLYQSKTPWAQKFRSNIRSIGRQLVSPATFGYTPLGGATETVLYTDNEARAEAKIDSLRDNKLIERKSGITRLTDFCTGFSIDLPEGMVPDFSQSPNFVRMTSDFFDIIISKERSPYEDIDEYIAYYLNRFITNEEYRANNGIELLLDDTLRYGENTARIISVKIGDMPQDKKDVYTFATIKTVEREFFRFLFKFRSENQNEIDAATHTALSTFSRREPLGTASYDLAFAPHENKAWNEETKAVYRHLKNSDDMMWGIFSSQVYDKGINEDIPRMEETLDFRFPLILLYNHLGAPLPDGFGKKCEEEGRMIELTVQMTETNNENLLCKSPMLETYKGKYDDKIRALAREIKEEIKTPFFFRLNNEMNTDWTNYSGIINLSDPEIYIGCWQRVYEIFAEEGVDNAIWVFNPNDRNYPPCNWNNYLAYYPGDRYVQMIGVTGYNTGTYFKDVTGEDWRSFTQIYDEVNEAYLPFFSEFPWMITEFASSSIGGNKPMWITNMFENLDRYPNIKAAVWFSAPDMDMRPGYEGKISRPYMLDETPETLAAFGKGLKKTGAKSATK